MRFQRFFPFYISQVLFAKTRKVHFNSTCRCGLIELNLLGVLAFASRKILGNLDRPDVHVFVSLVFVIERSHRFLIRVSTSESDVSALSLDFVYFPHPVRSAIRGCDVAGTDSNMQMLFHALNYKSNSPVKKIARRRVKR